MDQARIGSRVFYKDGGPKDTGTIVDIVLHQSAFFVKWDTPPKTEEESRDHYKGGQLTLVK